MKTGGSAGADGGMVKFGEVPVKFSEKNFTTKYADISAKFVNVVKLVKFFWNSYGFLKNLETIRSPEIERSLPFNGGG